MEEPRPPKHSSPYPRPGDAPPPAPNPAPAPDTGGGARPRRAPGWIASVALPAAVGAVAALAVATAVVYTRDAPPTVTVTATTPAAVPAAATVADGEAATAPLPVPPPAARGLSAGAIYRQVAGAVVRVESGKEGDGRMGTGFVIDAQGHTLTNAHVVIAGAKTVSVSFLDGSERTATVLGRDEDIDLAVLKVPDLPAGTRPVALGSVRDLQVGDPLVAIGNPLNFDRSLTTGVVSALERRALSPNQCPVSNVVQTDAAINQGNSGGPLFDDRGQVIGINSQIATENGGNIGIGLAMPIDVVKPVAAGIMENGRVQHAWMGILGRQMIPSIQKANGMVGQKGVMVVEVTPGGPSAKAGLKGATSGRGENDTPKGGDIIVAVDGHAVEDMADVSLTVSSHRVGDSLPVVLLRDGKRVTVSVTLANRLRCR